MGIKCSLKLMVTPRWRLKHCSSVTHDEPSPPGFKLLLYCKSFSKLLHLQEVSVYVILSFVSQHLLPDRNKFKHLAQRLGLQLQTRLMEVLTDLWGLQPSGRRWVGCVRDALFHSRVFI